MTNLKTLTNEQRVAIVAEAKNWIGTPYHGHSCLKGHGVDCGQLIYGVFRGCGLVSEIQLPKDYSLQVAKHRVSTEYVDIVDRFFQEIPESEAQPGDIVVYKLGHSFSHAAIIVSWPDYVIHAEEHHGVSGAHGIKNPWFRLLGVQAERIFRTFKGVE
jgi:NlpC/P60 family putative phage cell wall peptidase